MDTATACQRLFESGLGEGFLTVCDKPATHRSLGRGSPLPVCAGCAKEFEENGCAIEEAPPTKED